MSGNLLLNCQEVFSAAAENAFVVRSIVADGDYRIDEASVAPDVTAVASATFSVAILKVVGGTNAPASKLVSRSAATSGAPVVGNIREGLLQDPYDPTGSGLNLMQILAAVGVSNDFSALPEEDKPLIREGDIIAIVMVNSTPTTKFGVIVATVRGHQVPRGV